MLASPAGIASMPTGHPSIPARRGRQPLFSTPNHPSYPAAHRCLSTATAAILGYLFPRDATTLAALAEEANESRIWAGIHYHSDTVAGAALGRAIAGKVIDRARRDGSQERYRIGPGETRAVRVSGLT
jgi:membrane-associated phospholipid phosphatase